MLLIIVIAIIVLVILVKKGVFREADVCKSCGTPLKGTEQLVFNADTHFCLCKQCADKIHPRIIDYARKNWSYKDYTDYMAWEESTKEERSHFKPDVRYGYGCELQVDTERGLFSLGSGDKAGLVFRFVDLTDCDLNFKPEQVKEGLLNDKVKGNEYVMVELDTPKVFIEEIVNYGVKLPLKKKGIISTKYHYELTDEFMDVILPFMICYQIGIAKRTGMYDEEDISIGEVEKALALFMFDSIEEVTPESLKNQRNALIKAFHPDKGEGNDAYSQKINTAYDLLSGMIKK